MARPLPNVTLVLIDGGACPPLSKMALETTLTQVTPEEVLVFTEEPLLNGTKWYHCDAKTAMAMNRTLWYSVPFCVRTSHFFTVEWDGWVIDGNAFRDEWLSLDWISAPWPWHKDGLDVGNGMALRSVGLMRHLAKNYSLRVPEDDLICRKYRRSLEAEGFRWATFYEARNYAFERCPPRPAFAFQGVWNWPKILGAKELSYRMALINDHVRSKSEYREIQGLLKQMGFKNA